MLEAVAGAVQNDRDGAARAVEHLGDLVVAETLEIAQREDLGRLRAHLSEYLPNALFELLAQLSFIGCVLAPVGKVFLEDYKLQTIAVKLKPGEVTEVTIRLTK